MYNNLTPVWHQAFKQTLPVAMGYYPSGIAFGMLMSVAGFPLWLTSLLSLVLYSGAAQYAAIPLLASGAGIFTLTLNTFVINLRHVFYAIPLLSQLPKSRLLRSYSYFALTDESFSVLTTIAPEQRSELITPIIFLNHMYWITASIIGALVGEQLNNMIPHLDFALACLFVILLYEQLNNKKLFWPLAMATIAYFFSDYLSNSYLLLLAVGFCAAFTLVEARLPNRWTINSNAKFWSVLALVLLLLTGYLFVKNNMTLQRINCNLLSTPLSVIWQILGVFAMGAITFAIRAAPALIPRAWVKSDLLQRLNLTLPISVLLILIFNTLHLKQFIASNSVMLIGQLIALFSVVVSYSLKRNVLLIMMVGIAVLNFSLKYLS